MNPRRMAMVPIVLVGSLLVSKASGQTPLGTAFSYQGRLTDGANPADGSYDLRFVLYANPVGGIPMRPTLLRDDVTVTNGLFMVSLDFGPIFAGSKRWLEIGVRPGASTGDYSFLSFRQELTPVPNAEFALLAGSVAPGAVVTSLNGQTDNVTLAGTNGLSISEGAGALTVTSNATPANTASAIVSRDGNGNFGAGTIAVAGNLDLLDTSSDLVGVLTKGGSRFLHNFGVDNTFVGSGAGNTSLTGQSNTGVGTGTLLDNTTGGANAALGAFALRLNTTGFDNSAFGFAALGSNTTGYTNSAFGYIALASNATGFHNSAFGYQALSTNTTGFDNAAFGLSALESNTTGSYNSAFGMATLYSNATGSSNAAFGYDALGLLTSGDQNIALGSYAGANLTAGSRNIYIGNYGASSESNTIRIGSAQVATFIAGISGATSAGGVAVLVNSQGQLGTTTSSRRYKEGTTDLSEESDVLMKLRPVAFYYKPECDETHTRQYGLVAEEVAEVAPQLVVFDSAGAPQTVHYHFVNAMLLNEVQKQRSHIQDLEARLARLEAALAAGR